jgi:hypothetical protein
MARGGVDILAIVVAVFGLGHCARQQASMASLVEFEAGRPRGDSGLLAWS